MAAPLRHADSGASGSYSLCKHTKVVIPQLSIEFSNRSFSRSSDTPGNAPTISRPGNTQFDSSVGPT